MCWADAWTFTDRVRQPLQATRGPHLGLSSSRMLRLSPSCFGIDHAGAERIGLVAVALIAGWRRLRATRPRNPPHFRAGEEPTADPRSSFGSTKTKSTAAAR